MKKRFLALLTVFAVIWAAVPAAADDDITPGWDLSLPSLYETYAPYFPMGAAAAYFTDPVMEEAFLHHFNSITAENDMKPAYLSRSKGEYSFGTADRLVDWANENNIEVHGHTLVWHSQSTRWVNLGEDRQPLTRAEARENMEEYINNVAGHYAGRVVSWDVVNEAFTDNGNTPSLGWREGMRKNSPWYQAYANGADEEAGETGADYIYDAFVFARLADPGAVLYYNDYNEEVASKRANIAEMVEELNAKWKEDPRNTDPERLLIEVIGMQSHHFTSGLNPSNVRASIERFIETGAKVAVTELDLPYGSYATFTNRKEPLNEEELAEQARLYGELFEIYKEFAEHMERVTIWGIVDNKSWRAAGYPLLFDKDYRAKEAYFAVIDVVGAAEEVEEVVEEAEEEPEEQPEFEITEEEPVPEEEQPAEQPEFAPTAADVNDDGGGVKLSTILIIAGAVLIIGSIAYGIIKKRR